MRARISPTQLEAQNCKQCIPCYKLRHSRSLACRLQNVASGRSTVVANVSPAQQDSPTVSLNYNHAHKDSSYVFGDAASMSPLPVGVRVVHVSQPEASHLPFLLYIPDIDGDGVTSNNQWQAWAERFDMHATMMEADCICSFSELTVALRGWLERELVGTESHRPIYLLGEGFGGVVALQLAWESRRLVNRLILVNPATSYLNSQLARITSLLERLPSPLLNGQLPPTPQLPFPLQLPSPLLPFTLPSPLPVALAPLLGTSPQTLLRQLRDSLSSQQPAEAVQALSRALAQVEQISNRLTPATFLHRVKMLEEGIRMVEPRLPRISQRTMIIAGGQDVVLGSDKEAQRLVETMQRAFKTVLPDSGHALLYEPGGELLSLLDQEGFYIRRRVFSSPVRPGADVNVFGTAGPVEVPSEQEIRRYAASWTARLREFSSPVFLSTLADGSRVFGLEGLPYRKGPIGHDAQPAPGAHTMGESLSVDATGSSVGALTFQHKDDQVISGLDMNKLGEGPLLFVGNHQLYAFDMSVMVEEVLNTRGILMRGLAHPGLFRQDQGADEGTQQQELQPLQEGPMPAGAHVAGTLITRKAGTDADGPGAVGIAVRDSDESLPPAFMGNMFQSFGAVRVSPTAMYRLLAAGEAVLLYPGGVREGFKRRNEKYELFWPARSEFVRMAARFGATIIPVSAVGLEDSLQIVMDSDDIRKSPLWGTRAREQAATVPRARVGVTAQDGPDETFIPPLIAPAVPSRWYFLFGRPIRTSSAMYRDRAACDQVYKEVRSEVEAGISFLLRKREQDPYRDFLRRYVYEQNPPFGPHRIAPTFKI